MVCKSAQEAAPRAPSKATSTHRVLRIEPTSPHGLKPSAKALAWPENQNSTSGLPAGFLSGAALISVTAITALDPVGTAISCAAYPAALNVSVTFSSLRLTRIGLSEEPIFALPW